MCYCPCAASCHRLPIEGRTIQELKVKVASGRYRPIVPGQYSADLVAFCHSLLTVDPKKRPSLESILSSPAAQKWMRVVPNLPSAPPSSSAAHRRWSENGGPSAIDGPSRSCEYRDLHRHSSSVRMTVNSSVRGENWYLQGVN